MAVNQAGAAMHDQVHMAEHEIDLRSYLYVLASWWREMVGIAAATVFLTLLVAVVWYLVRTPMYEANAYVTIVRTVTDVQFDPRFRTLSDEQLEEGNSATNSAARRTTLVNLALSSALAQKVIGQLGDQLSAEEQQPARLLRRVEVTLVTATGGRSGDSDLIHIHVEADSPEKAAAIANTWAQTYVEEVNAVYGQAPDELLASIEAELQNAEESYLQAQAALEQFIAGNRMSELERQAEVFKQQAESEALLVERAVLAWQETAQLLATAQALRAQVAQGGDAAAQTSALAMQLLKIRAFVGLPAEKVETITEPPNGEPGQLLQRSSEQSLPGLQLQTTGAFSVTQAELLADVDALVVALQGRMADLEQQIAGRSAALEQPMPATTGNERSETAPAAAAPVFQGTSSQLYQKRQSLLAQLEAQKAQQARLEAERDLAWQTFETLNNKVAELKLVRAAGNREVRLAATAVPLAERADRMGLVRLAVAAAVAGVMLACFVALLAHYLGKPPFLSRGRPHSVLSPAGD